jgi:glutathione-independent formaldehyde dehydrogenase
VSSNRGVVYLKPGSVEVQKRRSSEDRLSDLPRSGRKEIDHGVILKVVTTNICGSDQHMVRGRTTGPAGMGSDTRSPARRSREAATSSILRLATSYRCLSTSHAAAAGPVERATPASAFTSTPTVPGGAYGYVDMGGWIGGQADYVMVPYADFNLLRFPDKEWTMEKIRDLTCLSDILPTGFHGAVTAKVGGGSTVYVAGAGPLGLAAAASARILGAAAVLIGDMNQERLAHATSRRLD